MLACLYLGDGGKTGEKVSFANSDPKIIKLFLGLFRSSFQVDEAKFRGRLMCRPDQEVKALEDFWSKQTSIPWTKFQKTRSDRRGANIPTIKPDYKGVFVVEYYSNRIFLELKYISDILCNKLTNGPVV